MFLLILSSIAAILSLGIALLGIYLKQSRKENNVDGKTIFSSTVSPLDLNQLETQQVSDSVKNIVNSLENVNNAVLRVGKIVVVKITDYNGDVSVIANTVSKKLKNRLDEDPNFLKDPQAVATFLQDSNDENQTSNFIVSYFSRSLH
jgi:hypothetical protein